MKTEDWQQTPVIMPHFCDVALPVPLDRVFTYSVNDQAEPPAIGCRVIVPFRNEKLTGIVTRVHEEPPPVEAKPIVAVLDTGPLLTPDLMELAAWISSYYIAPLGEVFRSMLPLMAEVKHQTLYRIADKGREVLYASANQGSSRRSRPSPADQDIEYNVLNYLEAGEAARASKLRSATGANWNFCKGCPARNGSPAKPPPSSATPDAPFAMRCSFLKSAFLNSTRTSKRSWPNSPVPAANLRSPNCVVWDYLIPPSEPWFAEDSSSSKSVPPTFISRPSKLWPCQRAHA